MSNGLPPGSYNLPPGVTPNDIDPPEYECSFCQRWFVPRVPDDDLCPRCERLMNAQEDDWREDR